MKRTKVMLGTLILGLGMAGAAWAQPAPRHDRDAAVYRYSDRDDVKRGDRDDGGQWRYNTNVYRRGDGDHDSDDRGAWNQRDNEGWRNQRNERNPWIWGYSNMRRGRIYTK
jgi:hypothetical protein